MLLVMIPGQVRPESSIPSPALPEMTLPVICRAAREARVVASWLWKAQEASTGTTHRKLRVDWTGIRYGIITG